VTIPLPWLFAAAAVAVVVWRSRAAGPVTIPPLSPTPTPLPSLSPAQAAGPSPLILAAVLVPWGLLAASHLGAKPGPAPSPNPAPAPDGWPTIDLRGAFVGPNASADALATERLLHWLSETVAQDRAKTTPRLATGAALDDLRKTARDFRMNGGTLGQKQPIAKERIAAFLDAAVGTDGGPVDAAGQERWQRAFNDISKAAAKAAGR